MATLGETIRTARRKRGLTLRQLAAETGLHYAYLSQLENNKTPGGAKAIATLADALGLERDALLTTAGRPPEGLARTIAANPELCQQFTDLDDRELAGCLRPFRLLGAVPAGPLTEAIEDVEDFRLGDLFPPEECFLLRVSGESMIEAHICDGDLVIVRPQDTVENGAAAVVLVNGEDATLKHVYQNADRLRLQPANAAMAPIDVAADEVRIVGRVIGVIRSGL